ncbi:MAG: response regulator [candidate division Zixibacteria bacterium]|nr:response regulator [candidate division Zixibacteria bacterium]
MKEEVTILVVDDEEMMRGLLSKILEKDGYSILSASSGAEALKIIDEGKVDLVITDVKMPEMNGFDLLKHIKEKTPQIGVIVMTAFGDAYTVRDALLLGADEYITKPFKSFEITMVVERAYWRIISSRSREGSTVK